MTFADAPGGRGSGAADEPPAAAESAADTELAYAEPDLQVVGDADQPGDRRAPLVPAPRSAPAASGAAPAGEAGLTDREREILSFERRWWRHAGAKEQAIRDTFDLSATRYYQLLNGLLDNPAALAAEPMLVGRLRRLRSARSRNRRR